MAAGLFLAPIINGGKDPKYQLLGVNLLFAALLTVVIGSFAGNFFAIAQIMPPEPNFWFGHQGYEYLALGRFWNFALLLGILFWLGLIMGEMVAAAGTDGGKENV